MAREWRVTFDSKLKTASIAELLGNADAYTDILNGLPLPVSKREQIDRLNIVRAIKGTTGIEGNLLTEEEIDELVEKNVPLKAKSIEEQEVLNADDVMNLIREKNPKSSIVVDQDIINKTHMLMTKDCDYEDNIPGEYRRDVRWAGNYICPDPKDIPGLMNRFIEYINSDKVLSMHPAVRAITSHFYLVSIHPFTDGNGRVARAVEAFLLYHGGYSKVGFYSLANYYYKNRHQYIKELEAARFVHNGELTAFVHFALEGFVSELKDRNYQAIKYLKVAAYKQQLDDLVRQSQIQPRVKDILCWLVDNDLSISIQLLKERTVPFIASVYSAKSDRLVRYDITVMRKLGLVSENEGQLSANVDRTTASNNKKP